jgi:hypothetical protein
VQPSYLFHVASGSSLYNASWLAQATGAPVSWNQNNSGNYIGSSYVGAINVETSDGRMAFYTGPSGTAGNAATQTARMTIPNGGDRLYFSSALHVTSATATGTTPALQSGTYTPTLVYSYNVASATAYSCHWTRVGNVVTVAGACVLDPSLAATITSLGITLPIDSNLAFSYELSGSGTAKSATAMEACYIYGNSSEGSPTGDLAQLQIYAVSAAALDVSFVFSYLVK